MSVVPPGVASHGISRHECPDASRGGAGSAARRVRVYLVDDHPVFREGVAAVIASDGRLMCVGQSADAAHALLTLEQVQADVVIVDLSLREGSGLDLLHALKASQPNLASLVLSMHEEEIYAERALRAGATGYLMKDAEPARLKDAVLRVAAGDIVVSESVNKALVRRAIHGHGASGRFDKLSDRELEVFLLIGRGFSTRDIAERLHLSVKTIETHRANIKHKLSIERVSEFMRAAVAAVESGLSRLPANRVTKG